MRSVAPALVAAALLAAAGASAQDALVDRSLAAQCAQCHGTDGEAVADMEDLAGKPFGELLDELLALKYDDDSGIMHAQARGYSDEQLARIADYFAALPPD
jgi:cytochrome c553